MLLKNLDEIKEKEIVKGCRARFIHSDNMTFAYWDIDKDSSIPAHTHPHEQVLNMLKGEFELDLQGEVKILKPNDVVIIPSNAEHYGRAISDCKILDVFYPVREEYK